MQCRNCGTEIADKAIVCYRCGAGTTDPVRAPVPVRPRRRPGLPLVAAVVLAARWRSFCWLRRRSRHAHAEAMHVAAEHRRGRAWSCCIVRLVRRR